MISNHQINKGLGKTKHKLNRAYDNSGSTLHMIPVQPKEIQIGGFQS